MLGLRALYFLFANLAARFYYLKHGLAIILTFIGFKLLLAHWFKVPIVVALGVIVITLTACIFLSIRKNRSLITT